MKTSKSNSFRIALVALLGPAAFLATALGQPVFQPPGSKTEATQAGASPAEPSPGNRSEKDRMQRMLKTLIERCKTDPELVELVKKQKIILQYTLDDLGMDFHFGFRNGGIIGDFGAPKEKAAEVHLNSTTEIFSGILLGRKDLKEATTELNLSLIRKLKLAKDMPKIGAELKRLYQSVCGQMGDPNHGTTGASLARN
jgi:hypothetical protein